jgi:hypothetical protein
MTKLQENPSALKREHPALQNMKFFNFFIFLWVIFALLDPDLDPLTWLYTDQIRIWNPTFILWPNKRILRLENWGGGGGYLFWLIMPRRMCENVENITGSGTSWAIFVQTFLRNHSCWSTLKILSNRLWLSSLFPLSDLDHIKKIILYCIP